MFGPPAVSSIGCNGHDETELQPGAGARISRAADVTMDSEPAVGVDSDTPDESRASAGGFLSKSPAGPRRAGAASWSDRESRKIRVVQSRGASARFGAIRPTLGARARARGARGVAGLLSGTGAGPAGTRWRVHSEDLSH